MSLDFLNFFSHDFVVPFSHLYSFLGKIDHLTISSSTLSQTFLITFMFLNCQITLLLVLCWSRRNFLQHNFSRSIPCLLVPKTIYFSLAPSLSCWNWTRLFTTPISCLTTRNRTYSSLLTLSLRIFTSNSISSVVDTFFMLLFPFAIENFNKSYQ